MARRGATDTGVSAKRGGSRPVGGGGKAPKRSPGEKRSPVDKRSRADKRAARNARFSQMRQVFTMTRQNDPRLIPLVLGVFLALLVVMILLGWFAGNIVVGILAGIVLGAMAGLLVFGRRASGSMIRQIEGQPGAAYAVVSGMRGTWHVTQAVQATPKLDVVHRAVGRPGVILLAEGNQSRTRQLVGQEKRTLAKVVGDTPIYEVFIGDGEGQVPLRRLQSYLTKLPRNIKPAQVNSVDARLRALGGMKVPIPKGPLPSGGRMPRGKVR